MFKYFLASSGTITASVSVKLAGTSDWWKKNDSGFQHALINDKNHTDKPCMVFITALLWHDWELREMLLFKSIFILI